jgi:hypothetical protein
MESLNFNFKALKCFCILLPCAQSLSGHEFRGHDINFFLILLEKTVFDLSGRSLIRQYVDKITHVIY